MVTDEVVWNPCVSANGDGKYDIKGCRWLDGTQDTEAPTPILNCPALGFWSDPPTLTQINGGYGINQIIGYYNLRASQCNALFGGVPLPIMAYLKNRFFDGYSEDLVSTILTLYSNIVSLKNKEGWVNSPLPYVNNPLNSWSLAWPNSAPVKGHKPYGDHIATLRKALAISGTWVQGIIAGGNILLGYIQNYEYARVDNPFGTIVSESFTGSSIGKTFETGIQKNVSNNIAHRYRQLIGIPILNCLQSSQPTGATLQISGTKKGSDAFNLALYYYSSDLTGSISVNTFKTPSGIMSITPCATGDIIWDVNSGTIKALSGKRYWLMYVSDQEYGNTPPANGGYFLEDTFDPPSGNVSVQTLIMTF